MVKTQLPSSRVIDRFHGKEDGKTALIILGGTSGADWKKIHKLVKPDILIGTNAVKLMVDRLDYWTCHENMNRNIALSRRGDKEARQHVLAWQLGGFKYGFINHKSYPYFRLKKNTYPTISRIVHDGFDFRKYGHGFLRGPALKHTEAHKTILPVGTAASRALHLAGILGCKSVHTIGLDLCFKSKQNHHWYQFPLYKPNYMRTKEMFIEKNGLQTQWIWVETAEFLVEMKNTFMKKAGLEWTDHSNGYIQTLL